MKITIYVLIVMIFATCNIAGCSLDSPNNNGIWAKEDKIDTLEVYIDELKSENASLIDGLDAENLSLSEEINYLEMQLKEAEIRIEILEEYVDELEQLLEDNNVEGFTSSHGSAKITKEKE